MKKILLSETKNKKNRQMKATKSIIILVLAFFTIISCSEDKQAELAKLKKQQNEISEKIKQLEMELGGSAAIDKSKLRTVSFEEIKPVEFKHYIEVQGKLDGEENVEVQPEGMGGAVQAILVKTGQYVTKGQVLARLNDAALRDQLRAMESTYALAKENFERQERLWEQKIGSEMQYLQAKSNKESMEGQISALKEQINMSSIKSPINGTVEEINIKIGQISSPQLPIPAFRIINFNSVKVKAEVAEAYSQKVSVGDNVNVIFPDLNREVEEKVSAVSRYINTVNRTFLVEVKLDPKKDGFKANMIAVLKITDYKNDKAICIPVKYIQTDLDGEFVFIIETRENRSYAKRVPIKQGLSYNGQVEITEGLQVGDKLIQSGYLDLENGEEINY
jgi:membrane fusion protein, multidrug efflux system